VKHLIFDAFTFAFLFAIGVVSVVDPAEESLLNINVLFGYAFLFIVIGLFVSLLLNKLKIKTWGQIIFEPNYKKIADSERGYNPVFWKWQMGIVLAVTLIVAVVKTQFSLMELFDQDGFSGAMRLFSNLFDPEWNILPRAILAIVETVFMAFLATALSIPFAFVLSFLAAKNLADSKSKYSVYMFLRTLMNVTRSIEALIWAIIFSVWVGIGPFAGMLALMVHSIASLTKQYSEIVESVNEGPIEGILSTGANRLQMIWFAIVPQVVLPYISFTVYRWDINVRMATIIGLVGGGGIGTMLIQYSNQSLWREVGCIVVVIAVVVWIMDQASAVIRDALK
jgi:phosphonate transport system permease protein